MKEDRPDIQAAHTVCEPIAIVGMGCVYPKARNKEAFWRNIVDKVDAVTEAPEDWDGAQYLDPNSDANDRVYTNRGGFLGNLARFDPLRHGVMPNSVDGGEPDQFLALEIAADAVEDAQFEMRPVPGDRVAVILGRGTYINRGFANVVQHGVMVDRVIDILRTLHPETGDEEADALKAELKASLPPFNSEMAAALVPNLVTGRISNRLNFRGANYIIDAACASSLVALDRGVADLRAGSCDMALVGGVHASTPAPIYQIFCQLGALSRKGKIRPFSAEADGTLLAEGVGILCIKRLSDAELAGDRIYALVRSVGVASDGKGMSILAPRIEGERLAIRRAYVSANVAPDTVGLVEAHGTATSVGDATEIDALKAEFGDMKQGCAIGSVKSMIGHCLPASGSAGLIKAALALHHRVLPPTLIDTSSPDLGLDDTGFYLNTEARPWIHGRETPRRAGVNAFGFGGINSHAILEEYRGAAEPKAAVSRPSEIIAMAAPDQEQSLSLIEAVARQVHQADDLTACAAALNAKTGAGQVRMAVTGGTREDILARLDQIKAALQKGRKRLRDRRGAYMSAEPLAEKGKVAFLFPGEGSQYRNMLAPLMLHFPRMREWFDIVDGAYPGETGRQRVSDVFFPPPLETPSDDHLWRMDVGPEAIYAANMAMATLYQQIGLKPDMLLGHSTGEYAALSAAGVTKHEDVSHLQKDIRDLNAVFAAAERDDAIAKGTLFTIGPVNVTKLRAALEGRDDVFLGMDNCAAQQVVVATSAKAADWVPELAKSLGGFCDTLPFGRAYHCPAFAPFSGRLEEFLSQIDIRAPKLPVYSCLTTKPFPNTSKAIKSWMAAQWSSEVRFQDTIRRMYDDGARIFVECGPRNNLTSFVGDVLRKQPHVTVAADTVGRQGLSQLHHLAAQLFAEGVPLDLDALSGTAENVQSNAKPLKMGLQPMALGEGRLPARERQAQQAPEKITPDGPPAAPSPLETLIDGYFDTIIKMMQTEQNVMQAFFARGNTQPKSAAPNAGDRFPMLSEVDVSADARSLRALIHLDHQIAPYLADHAFGRAISVNDPDRHGLSVVPLTFTMEALAEAAAALRPGLRVVGLREVRASRWITVEKPLSRKLEVTAEYLTVDGDKTIIRTRIRDAQGPVLRPVIAEADIELAANYAPAPTASASAFEGTVGAHWSLKDVYQRIMFHGPRLQAVKSMHVATPTAAEGVLIGLPQDDLLAATRIPEFEIDAITLDAVGQLVGVWSADQLDTAFHIFPFRVEHVEIFRQMLAPDEEATCRCDIKLLNTDEMRSDIDVVTADGHLMCRIKGWWDKRFNLPDPFFHARLDPAGNALSRIIEAAPLDGLKIVITECISDGLLANSGGIWAGVLAGLVLSDSEAAILRAHSSSETERFDWLRQRVAAKDAVRAWRSSGLCPADIEIENISNNQMRVAAGWPADWGTAPRIVSACVGQTVVAVATDPGEYANLYMGVASLAADGKTADLSAADVDLLPPEPNLRASAISCLRALRQAMGQGARITQLNTAKGYAIVQRPSTTDPLKVRFVEDGRSGVVIALLAETHRIKEKE
ncbi:type I polyketide synthase [Ruegeria profundi]|uniref:type I polyketide synthase n=1 Tax=Ruegeria profundi TaxID=1685378 RepID=UPI001CD3F547|nr:type I polyketide synthase [Ruegeria profundi]MCA0926784.1 polyketide synthase dehydratase domain-containing protein [Ruegeria profundi]